MEINPREKVAKMEADIEKRSKRKAQVKNRKKPEEEKPKPDEEKVSPKARKRKAAFSVYSPTARSAVLARGCVALSPLGRVWDAAPHVRLLLPLSFPSAPPDASRLLHSSSSIPARAPAHP